MKPKTQEEAADAYRFMLLMRRSEEAVGQLYALGTISVEPKLSIGREALVAGLVHGRDPHDPIVVGRRCHGFLLALGVELGALLSGLTRQSNTDAQAWAPSNASVETWPAHLYCQGDERIGAITTAISLALVARWQSKPTVVFLVVSDEYFSNQKFLYRLRAAVRWRLPIIFVIDHATPDASTSDAVQSQLSNLDASSQFRFRTVNGIDDQAVQSACREARAFIQCGEGPQGLVISTQAFRGHASKPSNIAMAGRGQAIPAHDPILLARERLTQNMPDGAHLAETIDGDIRALVRAASQKVRAENKP